jgi:hypothetical protein
MAETQTYANHRRWFPLFHFFVVPIFFIHLVMAVIYWYRHPSNWNAWNIVVAIGLVAFTFAARLMALRVQDRLIRLEERLRLQQILPDDLRGRIDELRPRHLVALRFCDDAEVPELCRAIYNKEIDSSKQIKQRIRKWRPDWLRA